MAWNVSTERWASESFRQYSMFYKMFRNSPGKPLKGYIPTLLLIDVPIKASTLLPWDHWIWRMEDVVPDDWRPPIHKILMGEAWPAHWLEPVMWNNSPGLTILKLSKALTIHIPRWTSVFTTSFSREKKNKAFKETLYLPGFHSSLIQHIQSQGAAWGHLQCVLDDSL